MSSSLYSQLPQTAETQLAAKMSDMQSEVRFQLLFPRFLLRSWFLLVSELVQDWGSLGLRSFFFPLQCKYKENGIKSLSQSLYSHLPETAETQLARTVSELQSEVRKTRAFHF